MPTGSAAQQTAAMDRPGEYASVREPAIERQIVMRQPMLSRLPQRLVVATLIAAVAGCGDMTPPLKVPKLREPAYGWEFENEGDHRLFFVRLHYDVPQGQVDATGGQLGPGDSTLWNV